MQNRPIILASGSPRRQQFLRELGLDFQILVADIDETPLANEAPVALAQRLAEGKAAAAATRLKAEQGGFIIAADTVVAQGTELLGKPVDDQEAVVMLRQLRNSPHHVHSAVCLWDCHSGAHLTRVNSTLVQMRNYSDEELTAYVASGDPLDKAGAYAIQHPEFAPVCAVDGCISGVIGLPLADLREMLAAFGMALQTPLPTVCNRHTTFGCCQDKYCF